MYLLFCFLIKSFILCGVLSAYYRLFLVGRSFHLFNRFYLVAAIPLSLVIPLLHISLPDNNGLAVGAFNQSLQSVQSELLLQWGKPLVYVLTSVSFVLCLSLVVKIFRLYALKRKYPQKRMNGFNFISTDLRQAPFTFLDNLFWQGSFPVQDETAESIFKHELTHIREKHTYDKLFAQFAASVFWMNPFLRYIQAELNLVHEFIADRSAVEPGDTASFAKMILASRQRNYSAQPSHGFFHSPVRRRLAMISCVPRSSFSRWRKILLIPALFWLTMYVSATVHIANGNFDKKLRDERFARLAGHARLTVPQLQQPPDVKKNP